MRSSSLSVVSQIIIRLSKHFVWSHKSHLDIVRDRDTSIANRMSAHIAISLMAIHVLQLQYMEVSAVVSQIMHCLHQLDERMSFNLCTAIVKYMSVKCGDPVQALPIR